MKLPIYQIDAFTEEIYGGNPACVVPLQDWLPDEVLLKIAKENAVAETAFFVREKNRVLMNFVELITPFNSFAYNVQNCM